MSRVSSASTSPLSETNLSRISDSDSLYSSSRMASNSNNTNDPPVDVGGGEVVEEEEGTDKPSLSVHGGSSSATMHPKPFHPNSSTEHHDNHNNNNNNNGSSSSSSSSSSSGGGGGGNASSLSSSPSMHSGTGLSRYEHVVRRERYLKILRDLGIAKPAEKMMDKLTLHFSLDVHAIDRALEDVSREHSERLWIISFLRQYVLMIDTPWNSDAVAQEDAGMASIVRWFSSWMVHEYGSMVRDLHEIGFFDSLFAIPFLTSFSCWKSSFASLGMHPSHFWALMDHLFASASQALAKRSRMTSRAGTDRPRDMLSIAKFRPETEESINLRFSLLQFMVHLFVDHLAPKLKNCREVYECGIIIQEFFQAQSPICVVGFNISGSSDNPASPSSGPLETEIVGAFAGLTDIDSTLFENLLLEYPSIVHQESIRRDMAFFLSQWDMPSEMLAQITAKMMQEAGDEGIGYAISLEDVTRIVKSIMSSAAPLVPKLYRAALSTSSIVIQQGSTTQRTRNDDSESTSGRSMSATHASSPSLHSGSSGGDGAFSMLQYIAPAKVETTASVLRILLTLSCLWHPSACLEKCLYWVSILDSNGDGKLDLEEVYVLMRTLHALYANPELAVPVAELADLVDISCSFFAGNPIDSLGVFTPQRVLFLILLQTPLYMMEFQFSQHKTSAILSPGYNPQDDRLSEMGSTATLRESDWVPDKEVSGCAQCGRPFTVTRRKHHCRMCGLVFCGGCSAHRIKMQSAPGMVRVCDLCYAKETGSAVQPKV
eukprot:ANDGO_03619.mRNA.1 Lateral signaling target protein 2